MAEPCPLCRDGQSLNIHLLHDLSDFDLACKLCGGSGELEEGDRCGCGRPANHMDRNTTKCLASKSPVQTTSRPTCESDIFKSFMV